MLLTQPVTRILLLCLIAAVPLIGCLPPAPDICAPGATEQCFCSEGVSIQVCDDDGQGWGACSCGDNLSTGSGVGNELPASAMLPVQYFPQACNEWCWAAGVTMIATYYGLPSSECELASAYSNFLYDCCMPDACSYAECNHGSGPAEAIDAAFQYVGVHGLSQHSALDEASAATELAQGRPLLVGFTGPFISHVAVISGYQTQGSIRVFHIMDPWFGEADTSYQELLFGGPDGNSSISDTWWNLHP